MPVRKVGIFGHVGTKNLGDETIIAAVIQNVRRSFPDAEVCAFTFHPEDTRLRHGIPAFPIRRVHPQPASQGASPNGESSATPPRREGDGIRTTLKKIPLLYPCLKRIRDGFRSLAGLLEEARFLAKSYRNLKGTNLLMVAGSGQLTDHSGGPWGYPYTFFKWSLLARATGTKLAFLSIGTSWVDSPLSRFFLRFALSQAGYCSYRDEYSKEQIEKWGPRGEVIVAPDLAYSFEMPKTPARPRPFSSLPVVGINPIPFFHETMWHQADKQLYDEYVKTQSEFASWLIRRGYFVIFFPTQLRADPVAIQDIVRTLECSHPEPSGYRTVDPPMNSHEDLISVMNGMDFVVAARFHGVLISHLLHKPVLAISYHAKTANLSAQMGQPECALDIDACTLDALTNRFLFVESHSKKIAVEMERNVSFRRLALDSQYERVFGLMKRGTESEQTTNKAKVWPKEPSNARINYGS